MDEFLVDTHMEAENMQELDQNLVLLRGRVTTRGRASGGALDVAIWAIWAIWEIRDGKMIRGSGFLNQDEALAAAGLAEQAVSRKFIDALRRAYEPPFGEEGLAAAEAFVAPDLELVDRTLPEAARELRGAEAVRAEVAQMQEAFEDIRYQVEDLLDLGDRVVVRLRGTGRGKGSGIQIDGTFGQVWTVRAGKAARFAIYGTWEEALAAVGLAE